MSQPLFFNYLEYSTNSDPPLIITHFPNWNNNKTNINQTNPTNNNTHNDNNTNLRIIHIPRTFNSEIPQFSTYLPGTEPGAIREDSSSINSFNTSSIQPFKVDGYDLSQPYSTNSISPLSALLNESEFTQIIESINSILNDAFKFQWSDMIRFLLDLLSGWMLGMLLTMIKYLTPITKENTNDSKQKKAFHTRILNKIQTILTPRDQLKLDLLELHIKTINEQLTNRGVEFLSPLNSGYLSLDVVIDMNLVLNQSSTSIHKNEQEEQKYTNDLENLDSETNVTDGSNIKLQNFINPKSK